MPVLSDVDKEHLSSNMLIASTEDIKRDDSWSDEFYVGESVMLKGVKMEIIKIKKLRKEIHLKYCEDQSVPEEDAEQETEEGEE